MADDTNSNPSDYLAAERTLLAWIRTGLALMGFGFVVARFGLFLQALQLTQRIPAQPYRLSFWFGTALIVLGVGVNATSVQRHIRFVRDLNNGGSGYRRPSSLAITVAAILAVLGAAMAVYLIWIRDVYR